MTERDTTNRRDYGSVDAHVDLNNGRAGDVRTFTVGWRPTCTCDAGEPVPCRVLDPFGGSGTVGLVCDQLGRDAVLIELNGDYVTMARDRIYNDAPLFAQVDVSPSATTSRASRG